VKTTDRIDGEVDGRLMGGVFVVGLLAWYDLRIVSCPRCCRDGAIWFANLVKKKVSQEEEEESER
jgi:hypothetical protein